MNARTSLGWFLTIAIAVLAAPLPSQADIPTLFRKKTVPSAKKPPTMNGLARLVTHREDDLKKYGSITIKAPDVWGESTLMSMVQEYERYMRVDAENFEATMQGYVARSDKATLQAEFAMGLAASNAAEANNTTVVEAPAEKFAPLPGDPTSIVPKDKLTLSLEPTEYTREHAVFLKVNQALRRTNLGDDNSRQPGYTSYVLRFPVSVMPGRETFKGCAAVVNLRARIVLGQNHLHDTFPRLAASDAASAVARWILLNWDKVQCAPECKLSIPEGKEPSDIAPGLPESVPTPSAIGDPTRAATPAAVLALYGEKNLGTLRCLARYNFAERPKADKLEEFIFRYLLQVQLNLERQGAYSLFAEQILETGRDFSLGCLQQVAKTRKAVYHSILSHYAAEGDPCPGGPCANPCEAGEVAAAGWILIAQSAILDLNIKRLLRAQDGTYAAPPDANDQELRFFEPFGEPYLEASAVWNQLIEDSFPVHLFTLDPIVEQQNYYDAFSRRRELQLAMAMAVAKGEMRARAAVRFTRQLSLDMLTIGLNRTAVAYAADNDTFGWYFYPRLQSPPEESSNIAAFARLLWSTGPTRRYDLRHRQLEPGIRECEAVIVMPAFVPNLKIDITTNWERLNKPGAIKVDYVKMIDEAAMIQNAVGYSSGVSDQECYRPEDYDNLCSRVDQLGKMLPMQQQIVRLPFPYKLGGTELFDRGNANLPPELVEYYGLEWLPMAKSDAKAGDAKPAGGAGGAGGGLAGGAGGSGGAEGGGGGGGGGLLGGAGGAGGGSSVTVTTNVQSPPPTAAAAKGGDSGVYLFLSGRHFHPTQTHVVAGGIKSDSFDATPVGDVIPRVADVVVISRELLRVKLTGIDPLLTKCCVSVYVATPAGVSNALVIPLQGTCPQVCVPRPGDAQQCGQDGSGCISAGSVIGTLDMTRPDVVKGNLCGATDITLQGLPECLKNAITEAKPLTVSVNVEFETDPTLCGSIEIPLDGRAHIVRQVPKKSDPKDKTSLPPSFHLAIKGASIVESFHLTGNKDVASKQFVISYADSNGLKCLDGKLHVQFQPTDIGSRPNATVEMLETPTPFVDERSIDTDSSRSNVAEDNPLRSQHRTSENPAESFQVPAPDALPSFDNQSPPLPSGARRPATRSILDAPKVQPAAAAKPIPLDKAARLQPVRLPPIRDTSVRQAAAWEK